MQIFVTYPHFEEVIIYDDAKPIFGETKSIPDEPTSNDMKAVTKRNKGPAYIIDSIPAGFEPRTSWSEI